MMMKIWIVTMVFLGVVSGESSDNDHNGKEHQALCDFLKVAVHEWGQVKSRKISDPLRIALKNTIFGYDSTGEDLDKLKSTLPDIYNDVGGLRGFLCGQPYYNEDPANNMPRWSGHSAPHGLVCLCTLGNNSWPFHEGSSSVERLCGEDKNTLGGEQGKKGWSTYGEGGDGKEQLQATWTKVTAPCLKDEKPGDLKEALKTFIRKLNQATSKAYENMYLLGEGNISSYEACDGKPKQGVCAKYFPNVTSTQTWWSDLEKALVQDEEEKQKKQAEEAARKQKEDAERKDSAQEAALNSSPTTTNQTEQHRNDNFTDKLCRYNLTSGTPISLPTSWLLSALLLI